MTGLSAKTAFVYFSATGTTERMAKNAAKEMGADIFEIQPVHMQLTKKNHLVIIDKAVSS